MAPVTRSQRSADEATTTNDHDLEVSKPRLRSTTARQVRKTNTTPAKNNSRPGATSSRDEPSNGYASDEPPRFIIDLSLPPEQRYLEVCTAFEDQMLGLTALFDEVVGGMVPFLPVSWLKVLCRLFLRRVYDSEGNAELLGISRRLGVEMYLLVCFNVLLDLMMGCSSGGARVRNEDSTTGDSKMLHFRTLDWDMPALRKIVIQLDFCLKTNGPIVASSITYAGFVGVLTGVRPGLSLSLNFRPNRIDNGNLRSDISYITHMVLVLLGLRASITSVLRGFLLPRVATRSAWTSSRPAPISPPSFTDIVGLMTGTTMAILTTTVCYLCLCSGQETTVVEKDLRSAMSRTSRDFVVVTNADDESSAKATKSLSSKDEDESPTVSLNEVIAEAKDREQCAVDNWKRVTAAKTSHKSSATKAADLDDVVKLVQAYPTTNECTHFACVLDPTTGVVRWCRRYHETE